MYKHFSVNVYRKNKSDSNAEQTLDSTPSGSSEATQAETSAAASSSSSHNELAEYASCSSEGATVSLFLTYIQFMNKSTYIYVVLTK